MENKQLNELVVTYQETGSDFVFSDIYNAVLAELKNYKYELSTRYRIEADDVESELNLLIYELAMKYDETKSDFINLLRSSLRNKCIDLQRSNPKFEFVDNIVRDDEGQEQELLDLIEIDEVTDKDSKETIRKLVREDQRQLVHRILCRADEGGRQAALALVENETYNRAAKSLGTCHKTIKRRIRKLANLFDANREGNLREYLTA